jgi:hypothetical protein
MKPRIITNCVASRYAAPNERIVEFADDAGNGGLISIRTVDGRLIMDVYRQGPCVEVRVGKEEK